MIDHVSIGVCDLSRSIALYDAVLAPLGFVRVWTTPDAAGYGEPGGTDAFAIKQHAERIVASYRQHVAFRAWSRDAVTRFHQAALAHGASDNGAPGLHPEYGAGYFAAFATDWDGHHIEAVLHEELDAAQVRSQ